MLYTLEALKLPLDADDAAALRAWSGPLPLPHVKVVDGRVREASVAVNDAPLAPEIARLRGLRALQVTRNTLHGGASSIPDLSRLTELVRLDVSLNPIGSLPTGLVALEELRAFECGLTKLPEELFSLRALRVLQLARNRIGELSPLIGQLRQLRELDLGGANLQSLPETIGELRELRKLAVAGWLPALPESVGQLVKLERLSLSGSFSALPTSFRLAALRELEVNAPLTHVPEGFSKLPLKKLTISSEVLRALPDVPTLEKLVVPEATAARLKGRMAKLAKDELDGQAEAERLLREAWEDR